MRWKEEVEREDPAGTDRVLGGLLGRGREILIGPFAA